MSGEVERLLASWEEFIVPLRMRDGFDDAKYAELKNALDTLASAWAGLDALPRLGVNVLVDVVPTMETLVNAYQEPTSSKIIESTHELQELVWRCVDHDGGIMPAIVELGAITVDCAEPGPVAAFYAAVGGGEITRGSADSAWVSLAGTTVIFRRIDGYQAPTWPSPLVPMQVHFEFFVDDLDDAEARLHEYGATTSDHQPHNDTELRVMLDPAGRPFCIGTKV